MDTATIAGVISTTVFAGGNIPMLVKALRTKDLRSYSLTMLLLSNFGNAFHWIYVVSLPMGPIWFLHTFYTISAGLMLLWYFRFRAQWGKEGVELARQTRELRRHDIVNRWRTEEFKQAFAAVYGVSGDDSPSGLYRRKFADTE